MDGWITIGTKLDSRQLERDLKDEERKLQQFEKEAEKLTSVKAKIEVEVQEYEKQKKAIEETTNEALKHAQTEEQVAYELEMEQMQLQKLNEQYSKQFEQLDSVNKKIQENVKNQELMKNEIVETNKKLEQSKAYDRIKTDVNEVGKGVSRTVKKVARWGLALVGIRGAYSMISQAMSTLSQNDKTMKANIDYIKFALANVLKPVIEWIINAVYKVLTYINYIAHAWFGVNLFANSSAKAFANANKNAQKLQKTMLSFDEANVMSSNKQDSVGTPSYDLSNLGNVEIPDWVKWIAEHKEEILTVAGIVAGLFGASVIAGWISNLTTFMGAKGLGLLATKLGTLVALAGGVIITALVAKKVWDEAAELKKQIQEIRNEGAKAQDEWIKKEEDVNTLIVTGNVNRQAGYDLLKKSGGVWNWINGLGQENLETAKQTAINIGKQVDKEVELYKQGKLNDEQQKKVKQNIIDQYQYNLKVIEALQREGKDTKEIETLNQRLIQNYKDMGGNVEEVRTELGNINKIKFDNKTIEVDVNADINSYKQAINRALEYAKQKLGSFGFSAGGGGNIGGSGGGFRAKGGIYYPGLLPKLAVGGIINNPGPGIAYHGATIGERGAEAVVPLTDSQQMELLGATIGKYISINLTNITELDGRQIARKVEQISQNDNFVLNR